jgi:hypothetical protein
MRRNYPYFLLSLFLICTFCLFSSTHVFDERSAAPVFSERKTERVLPQKVLPELQFSRLYRRFFSQFAP